MNKQEAVKDLSSALDLRVLEARHLLDRIEQDLNQWWKDSVAGKSVIDLVKSRNPAVYRFRRPQDCEQLVSAMFSDFLSASLETVFGHIYEHIARALSGGTPFGGIDILLQRANDQVELWAVKSGNVVFNSASWETQKRRYREAHQQASGFYRRATITLWLGIGYGRIRQGTHRLDGLQVHIPSSTDFWRRMASNRDVGGVEPYHRVLKAVDTIGSRFTGQLAGEFARLVREAEQAGFCEGDTIIWETLETVPFEGVAAFRRARRLRLP